MFQFNRVPDKQLLCFGGKVLLSAGADVHAAGANGTTALICASWSGHSQVVEVRLEEGVSNASQ